MQHWWQIHALWMGCTWNLGELGGSNKLIITEAELHVWCNCMERKHGIDGKSSFFGSAGKRATELVLFAVGRAAIDSEGHVSTCPSSSPGTSSTFISFWRGYDRQRPVAQWHANMSPLATCTGSKSPGTSIVQYPRVVLQWQPQKNDPILLCGSFSTRVSRTKRQLNYWTKNKSFHRSCILSILLH